MAATRASTVLVLSAMAVGSIAAERNGLTADLPMILKPIAESCAHPVLGYDASMITYWLTHRFQPRVYVPAMILAASSGDGITEIAQDKVSRLNFGDFLANGHRYESGKDYLFALGGLFLFAWQGKRYSRRMAARRLRAEQQI